VIENLYNEKQRLESLVNDFKSDNEEYLKLKRAAYKEVKSVLTNGKLLLQFAAASVIESLRMNPELYRFVSYSISNKNHNDRASYGSNCLSLMSEQQQTISDDIYTAVLLEEAEKLYNKLTTELTNSVITAKAVAIRTAPSLLSVTNNSQNEHIKWKNLDILISQKFITITKSN
jgi:hypothetical protein